MHAQAITVKRVDAVLSEDFLQEKNVFQERGSQTFSAYDLNLSAIPLCAVSQQTPSGT